MTPSAVRLILWLCAAFAVLVFGCRESGPGGQGGLSSAGSPISAGSAGSPALAASPGADCPSAWLEAPAVDRSIAVPDGNRVVLHASAKGTQDYICAASDGGPTYGWSLRGPDAALSDCRSSPIGRHFASEAGPPEWQLSDGTYVVAHKTAQFVANAGSAPWLLLDVDRHGGEGRLGEARYVQRVSTVGGGHPDGECDARHAGTVQKVAYEAQYFFYAPAGATSAPGAASAQNPPASGAAADQPVPDTIIAQHVLVVYKGAKRAPKDVTRTKVQARARAQEALSKIQSGVAFEDVVKTYSDDAGSVDRMGSLGKFHKGDMDPTFAAAAFALKVGQVSDVVETPFGFHVIKRTQ
jgi:peptidyl-prolyl cis-trans isomerase NIMA-interacting 1